MQTDARSSSRPVVAHLLHQDGLGGGPISVRAWLRELESRYENHVLSSGDGVLAEACRANGYPLHAVPIGTKAQCLWGWWPLRRVLRRIKPDVLVLHGQWGGLIGALVGRSLRIPMIYVVRWTAFHTDWNPLRAARNYISEWFPSRWSARLIFLSASTRYLYLHRQLTDTIRGIVIPNPIDLPATDPSTARQQLRATGEWLHVVALGRLVDQKGFAWLLQAWSSVRERHPEALLTLIGDGPLRNELAEQSQRLNLAASCRWLGARADGAGLLAMADVVVISSMYETFGRVAAEAMAWGRPIVAFDCDGIRDMIVSGQNGWLVATGDAGAFADAICRLLENPDERHRLGEAGREAARQYVPARIMPQIMGVIDAVAGGRA
ncbi:MAG: glycosyltransferase family 4 protein [Verrucomicrobia bacterium]|nr:glycosyltransferase family 4 protein [Verrucomicrobiota bacterium]